MLQAKPGSCANGSLRVLISTIGGLCGHPVSSPHDFHKSEVQVEVDRVGVHSIVPNAVPKSESIDRNPVANLVSI